jgi:pimeloyl-ACP methyl ester carboxylesterase
MTGAGSLTFIEGPGPRLACEVFGAGPDAPALLFAHGNSSHRGIWRPVANLLVRELELRFVLIDLRGHGDSEHVYPAAYNPGDHAGDLARVVRHLGLTRYAVVGHSAGALAVTTLAARLARNELVGPAPSALVWVDIDPCVPEWQVEFFHQRADSVGRSYSDLETATRALIRGIQKTSPNVSEELLWDFIATGLEPTPEGCRVKLDPRTYASWAPGDLRPLLPLVDIPALVIRAADSGVSSVQGFEELKTGFLRARGEVVEGGTHFVPLDHAAEVAQLIAGFLRRERLA